jgi:hypothetical protein
MTPKAFFRNFSFRVNVSDSVRAGRHTVPASDAPMWINVDDPIWTFDSSVDGTDYDTDGIFAVVADDWQEIFFCVREPALLNFFNPTPPYTQWDIVFALAGNHTRRAPYTLPQIEEHSQSFSLVLFQFFPRAP